MMTESLNWQTMLPELSEAFHTDVTSGTTGNRSDTFTGVNIAKLVDGAFSVEKTFGE